MNNNELLTPEEFAERLKIGRSTLFDWLGKGILVPGQHYFKIGRVLRFVWSDELVQCLLERTVTICVDGDKLLLVSRQINSTKSANKKKPSINLEY
ncbi:MAG: helix-turn-helix domain-containing protein [Trichlorobacter sp.]|uniref:helix-turn-helix transcriptional regulator n=1 Tax=Trichlorobacter sp. TaxID=2911007 RepID=UPI00255E96E7|nr:helix-turn-helix domain-containing protein [Trichlorobacter sp.]MDK9717177.1 helix-turn-helix domain-containing protein [Trichlorobacter sp.]